MSKALVPQKMAMEKAMSVVPYLTPEEVYRIAEAAKSGHKGERDSLLVLLLFQTGLRISEALPITPRHIEQFEGKPVLRIWTLKAHAVRLVALPESLAHSLYSYAYKHKLELDDTFFPTKRLRAWQIVKSAAKKANINKRVYPHLFRHSDAIYRLRETGNPKALQIHLGHSSPMMTMRYLSTLTAEDALRIQQGVTFEK